VRNFEKNLDKIHRKLAKQVVGGLRGGTATAASSGRPPARKQLRRRVSAKASKTPAEKFSIYKPAVEKHLGKPIFRREEVKRADRPGMTGAWPGRAWGETPW
jgi:ATP-dependent Lon protease